MLVVADGGADHTAEEWGLGFLDAEEGDAVGVDEVGDVAATRDGFEGAGEDGAGGGVGPETGFCRSGLS